MEFSTFLDERSVLFVLCFFFFSSFTASFEDLQRINASLQAYGQTDVVELTPLKGGMDHVMVHARFGDGGECALRLLKMHRSEEAVIREVEATQLASECGVGPKVCFFDPTERVLILEYLPPDGGEIDEEEMIPKLKRMHQVSFPHTTAPPEPFAFIDRLYQNVCEREATPIFYIVEEAMNVILQIYEVLKWQPAVMCHGDFHKNNVIKSRGEVYLIDWTTAAPGDRFYDLAKYTLPMIPGNTERLLNIYCGGEATFGEKAHFFLTQMTTLMTLVLNRYPCIENDTLETFETIDFSLEGMTAMHTQEGKRLGALKALKLFFEKFNSDEFDHALMTLASTNAA